MTDESWPAGMLGYVQLPAVDAGRAARFYGDLFGWQISDGEFRGPGDLHGTWVTNRTPSPDTGPVLWLTVDDMTEALSAVEERGGRVVDAPFEDGPTRILATVTDSEGQRLGLVGPHHP